MKEIKKESLTKWVGGVWKRDKLYTSNEKGEVIVLEAPLSEEMFALRELYDSIETIANNIDEIIDDSDLAN